MRVRRTVLADGEVVEDFPCLHLLCQGGEPQRCRPCAPLSGYIAGLRGVEFLSDEVVEGVEVICLKRRKRIEAAAHLFDARGKVALPQRVVQTPLVQGIGRQGFQLLRRPGRVVVPLDGVLPGHDAVAHVHHAAQHRPRGPRRIEQRVAGVEQVGLHPMVVLAHGELQHRLIEQHLHQVILLGHNLLVDGIFIRLAGLHFNKRSHVALHIVQTPLQAQSLAQVGRLQHGIPTVQPVARGVEGLRHRLAQVVEVELAVFEELPLLLCVAQVGAGCQFNGIEAKSLLHADQVIRLDLGMNPFVQEEVDDVSQQQRTGVVHGLEAHQHIVQWMVPVCLETLGQGADVYQIVRLQHEERRGQHARLVHRHIQQVELCTRPKEAAGLVELLIDLVHTVAHPQRFIAQRIGGTYI